VAKSEYLKVRLESVEAREIERAASALGLPKSKYARLLLVSGSAQPQDKAAAPAIEDERLSRIEADISGMRADLQAALAAYERLASSVAEMVRVPTLAEYRIRRRIEGHGPKSGSPEAEAAELVERIREYRDRYGRDVDRDPRTWGRLPTGYTAEKILAMVG